MTGRAAHVAAGAVGGLAWAAALRAYMAELVGTASRVEWAGTFLGILAPGALVGAGLGLAVALRAEGDPRARWLAASPLAFAVFPQLLPGGLVALLTTGMGGAAIAFAFAAIAGGYALGGGRVWARLLCGLLAVVVIAGVVLVAASLGGHPLTEPRGAWQATLVGSLLVVLMIAASIPFRPLPARGTAAAEAARPTSAASTSAGPPAASRRSGRSGSTAGWSRRS